MKVTDIWPSKYVKAGDLGDKLVTVTISTLVMEDMGYGAEAERKPVLYFEKATKGMVVNRTNGMIIASLYGPETDNWAGKRITLYAAKVKAFGSWQDAIRVKDRQPPAAAPSQPMPEAMQEAPPVEDEHDLLDVDEGQEPSAGAVSDDGKLAALKEERINIEMSDLEKNHEARELARIDAEIAKATPAANPFDDEEPEKPRATLAQIKEIEKLGKEAYGAGYNGSKLAQWKSGGARDSVKTLFNFEAATLIKALKKKISDDTVEATKVAGATGGAQAEAQAV